MGKIIVFVGPPCSGKSTYANKLLDKHSSLVRVNKDSYRYMLTNKGMCSTPIEKLIDDEQEDLVDKLLDLGLDVVMDNTHCKVGYLERIKNRFADKARIEVILFETPLWILKVRNIIRYIKKGIWIPTSVIERMNSNFKKVKIYVENSKCIQESTY